MIVAAGLLVLLGLGLFVAGLLTGATALYWGCVAACAVAAVLLVVVRRRLSAVGVGGSRSAVGDGAAGTPETTRSPTGAAETAGPAVPGRPTGLPDPGVEDVEVTDLLLVVDLKDEVLVVDEHPRYHLASCRFLAGRTAVPLPLDEARVDGFTPCALCTPDRNLADRAGEGPGTEGPVGSRFWIARAG